MYKTLVINPGSTSTKIAFYHDTELAWKEEIKHPSEVIKQFATIYDQLDMRTDLIMKVFESHGEKYEELSVVMCRGGLLPAFTDDKGTVHRVGAGAYLVDDHLIDTLFHRPINNHASNLACAIGDKIAKKAGVKAYIYDPVTVDALDDLVRITGIRSIVRIGQGHNLNMRAAAKKVCENKGWDYSKKNLIVAHLGGGSTVSLHKQGRIVDIVSDDEGQFSPERAGLVPIYRLLEWMKKGNIDPLVMKEILSKKGGMVDWFGTADAYDIELRGLAGDKECEDIYNAMALSIARSVARLACYVGGKVDAIILTGSIARSKYLIDFFRPYAEWMGPIEVIPGENEMQALCNAGVAILSGTEKAKVYGPDM